MPITSNSNDPDRFIESIDLRTGEIKDRVDLKDYIYGHYLDDGWLTIYDGWAYIASYTNGLFGETTDNKINDIPTLVRVAVDDGVFDDNSFQTIVMPNNTQQSGLVVYNDRGYIHSGNTLVVIDMDEFKIIYTNEGSRTHGGIVLNTHYATPENNYKVYIYLIPYGNGEDVCVYEDDQTMTEGVPAKYISDIGYSEYATSHVRTTASGYLYWYNDSSIFFVAGATTFDVEFVVDGEVVTSMKTQNGDALTIPDAPRKAGYSFVGWFDYDGTPVTASTRAAGDMTIMAVYAPVVENANGLVYFDYYATEFADEVEDAYVLLIAEYGDNVIWSYQKVVFDGELCQRNVFAVSEAGLRNVSISVVDGCDPTSVDSVGRVTYQFA